MSQFITSFWKNCYYRPHFTIGKTQFRNKLERHESVSDSSISLEGFTDITFKDFDFILITVGSQWRNLTKKNLKYLKIKIVKKFKRQKKNPQKQEFLTNPLHQRKGHNLTNQANTCWSLDLDIRISFQSHSSTIALYATI